MRAVISPEMTVNQVLKKFPRVTGVFNRFNIDSCCGGARTLEEACREDGADLEALLQELRRSAGK